MLAESRKARLTIAIPIKLVAPCGMYCGVCGVYTANRDNNQKLKDKLANAYGVTPEQSRRYIIIIEGFFIDKVINNRRICQGIWV